MGSLAATQRAAGPGDLQDPERRLVKLFLDLLGVRPDICAQRSELTVRPSRSTGAETPCQNVGNFRVHYEFPASSERYRWDPDGLVMTDYHYSVSWRRRKSRTILFDD